MVWVSDAAALYEADKGGLIHRLALGGADAVIYRYDGKTPRAYAHVLKLMVGEHTLGLKQKANVTRPSLIWSATTARNPKLHHYHAAHSQTPKLIKVTTHRNRRFPAQQRATDEAKVHIALAELQSRYVPMLFDARVYDLNEDMSVTVTVMLYLTGAPLADLLDRRRAETGSKYILASERDQLAQAIRDMWSVGCVHNDLHLSNIIVTAHEHLYVIDFSRSFLLPKSSYTQVISLAQQRKRIRSILGPDAPVLKDPKVLYDVAGKELHAYPEYFTLHDMSSRRVLGRRTKQQSRWLRQVDRARKNVSAGWNQPTRRTWKRLADKVRVEHSLNKSWRASPGPPRLHES